MIAKKQGALTPHLLSIGAIILNLTGFLLIAYLHIRDRKDPPLSAMVSDYARPRAFGFLMNCAFVVLGMSAILLGFCTMSILRSRPIGWDLVASGACIYLLSIFTTDSKLPIIGKMVEGGFHDLFVAIGFLLAIVDMGLVASFGMGLGGDSWFRGFAASQCSISFVGAVAHLVLVFLGQNPKHPHKKIDGAGLSERIIILLLIEWELALGLLFAYGTVAY